MKVQLNARCVAAAAFSIVAAHAATRGAGVRGAVALDVDWPSFLARSDVIYNMNATTTLPRDWTQSLYGGNGDLGFMLHADSNTEFRVMLGRQTLYDDRTPRLPAPYYLGNLLYDRRRHGEWSGFRNGRRRPCCRRR